MCYLYIYFVCDFILKITNDIQISTDILNLHNTELYLTYM